MLFAIACAAQATIAGPVTVAGPVKIGGTSGGGGSAPTRVNDVACMSFSSPTTCNVGTVSTGNVLLVVADDGVTTGTFTVTDNCGVGGASDTFTVLDGPTTIGTYGLAESFAATVGAGRSGCTVTLANTGAAAITGTVYAISGTSGVDAHAAFNYQSNPSGTNGVTSTAITTTHADLVIGWTCDAGTTGDALLAGTNIAWTLRATNATFPVGEEDFTQSAAGAITAAFTYNGGTAAGHLGTTVVAFKP